MKTKYLKKSVLSLSSIVLACALFMVASCDSENELFDYPVLPSYHDGIQNGDEEGVDCGGNSGVPCPTHNDGIQNLDEEGIDCGGSSGVDCPEDTPRFDMLIGTGLPFFHTFETEESGDGIALAAENSVTMDFAFADPAGSDEIVGRYSRPEGLVADGYSDYKFETFASPIDFSTYHKFYLSVYMPSSNNYGASATFVPTVEIIFLDSSNPAFWETWTVLSAEVDEADFDSWVKVPFNGGDALANANIYDTVAIRIGGSNHTNEATFYVKDFIPTIGFTAEGTPRKDALLSAGLPYFYTFEADGQDGGFNLEPRYSNPADGTDYTQGVDVTYGVADPAGGVSTDGVARVWRPDDGRFGGFEDYKMQPYADPIDFSTYHKFKLDVFIPSSENDFTGQLSPTVVLVLHDNVDGNFWQRWTTIAYDVAPEDFDKWITIEFDGSAAASANDGTPLMSNTNYDNISFQFGGSGHTTPGVFYIKDFVPYQ